MNFVVIGFSKPRKFSLVSWLIRKLEKTSFSHVYIKIYDSRINRWIVYEAAGLLVHCSPQDTFYKKNKHLAESLIPCSPDQEIEILTAVTDCLAKPYGIKQLFGLSLVRICRLFGIKIRNPLADGCRTYVCSEFCGLILSKLGYDIKNLDDITPRDIYEMIYGEII